MNNPMADFNNWICDARGFYYFEASRSHRYEILFTQIDNRVFPGISRGTAYVIDDTKEHASKLSYVREKLIENASLDFLIQTCYEDFDVRMRLLKARGERKKEKKDGRSDTKT